MKKRKDKESTSTNTSTNTSTSTSTSTGTWSNFDGYRNVRDRKIKLQMSLKDKHGRPIPVVANKDVPMKQFRDNIDLERLCLFMSGKDKYEKFIEQISKPENARLSFSTICRRFNISLHELQVLYSDGMRNMALIAAANSAETIMQDVTEDAMNVMVACTRCDGNKNIVEVVKNRKGEVISKTERICPICDGVGKVKQKGDDHSRDIVFETMKLTGQKGPLVAIQQNFGGGDGLDAKMEDVLKNTQMIALENKT